MPEKNPDKLPQKPASTPETKPNGFQRLISSIGNGMESVGKGLYTVVKEVAKIPVALVKGADSLVSHIPIAGEVYGAGKEVVKGVWGVTEELPVLGSVFQGLREGAMKVAGEIGFTTEDKGNISKLQEGLILTPDSLQKMLDEATNIPLQQKDILQTAIMDYRGQIDLGRTVSQEDLGKLRDSITDANMSENPRFTNNAERMWDIEGINKNPSGVNGLSSLSFSQENITEEKYKMFEGNLHNEKTYESLSERQKQFLDFCWEKICPGDNAPTDEQKRLLGDMVFVSESFENGHNGDTRMMVQRMQDVKNNNKDKIPAEFLTIFNEALQKGEKIVSEKPSGGH